MQESRRKRKKELLDLERPVRKKNREPEAMLTVSDVDWTSELTTTLWTKLKTCRHFIVSFPKYITVNSLNWKKRLHSVIIYQRLKLTSKIAKEEVHSSIFLAQSWHVSEYLSLSASQFILYFPYLTSGNEKNIISLFQSEVEGESC